MKYYLVTFYPNGEIRDINSYDDEESRDKAFEYFSSRIYKLRCVKHNEVNVEVSGAAQ